MANEIRVTYTADARDIEGGAKRAQVSLRGLTTAAAAAGAALATAAAVGFAAFARRSIEAASRAQETENLFRVSFGNMAQQAEEWAQRTNAAVGVNDTTLQQFSGTLFNMVSAMGVSRTEAFNLATGFTELALDASSFFNIPFEEAFNKIRSGLAGESEPLKQLGVLVTQNTIEQTAFAQSILNTGRELTEQEKVIARSIVIQQGLSNASGDLIRTQDSFANQTRLLGETFVELQETFGTVVVQSPAVGQALSQINSFIQLLTQSIEEDRTFWVSLVQGGIAFGLDAFGRVLQTGGFLINLIGQMNRTVLESGVAFLEWAKSILESVDAIAQVVPGGERVQEFLIASVDAAKQSAEGLLETAKGAEELGEKFASFGVQAQNTAQQIRDFDASTMAAATSQNQLAAAVPPTTNALVQQEQALEQDLDAAIRAAQAFELLPEPLDESKRETADMTSAVEDLAVGLDESKEEAADFGDAMSGINDILSEARGLMNIFGVESDSALGRAIELASRLFDTFNSLSSIIGRVAGLFGGGGQGGFLGGLASAFGGGRSGAGGLAGSLGGIFGLGGGAAGATGAAGAGLAGAGGVGAGVASAAGPLGGAGGAAGGIGIGALGATGIGAAVVGAIFAIRAALKQASAETTADAIGLGQAFGNLSDSLRERIQTLGEELGDFATGIQLSLGDIAREGVLSEDELAQRAADTFSFLERGDITEGQAASVLADVIPQLLGNLDQLGDRGTAQIERLLRAAQDFGVEFEGMDELVQEFARKLAEDAAAGGDQFLNTLNELGVTGRESLEFIKNFAEAAGIELDVLDQILAALGEEEGPEKAGEKIADEISGGAEIASKALDDLLARLDRLRESGGTGGLGGLGGGFVPPGDGPGGIPPGTPVTGAQRGFSGVVTGPHAFFIEPGVTESVNITDEPLSLGVGGIPADFIPDVIGGAINNAVTSIAEGISEQLSEGVREALQGVEAQAPDQVQVVSQPQINIQRPQIGTRESEEFFESQTLPQLQDALKKDARGLTTLIKESIGDS